MKKVKFSLHPQDAGLLVDLVGMCRTPGALLKWWKFTEQFVPQVSKFIQEFNKEAKKFQDESEAIYKTFFDKVEVEGEDPKSKLKQGKTMEDFNNVITGSRDDFQVKVDALKNQTTEYSVDVADFKMARYYLADDIDLSMPNPAKEKDPEIFTAQLYSVVKYLNDIKV